MPEIAAEDIREEISRERHRLSFYESEYVGNVIRTIHRPWAMPAKVYSQTKLVKFEDDSFIAPLDYETYLRYRYGDYMVLPPENRREQHTFPSFII